MSIAIGRQAPILGVQAKTTTLAPVHISWQCNELRQFARNSIILCRQSSL
jgi:hypothetical protein